MKSALHCIGCGYKFKPEHGSQSFCSPACRKDCHRNEKSALGSKPYKHELLLTHSGIAMIAHIKRCRRPGAIGYCLLHAESKLIYPLPGKTRRFRGNFSKVPYYELDPFVELPVVSENGLYYILWYTREKQIVAEKVNTDIVIDFAVRLDYRMLRKAALHGQLPARAYTKTEERIERYQLSQQVVQGALPGLQQEPVPPAAAQLSADAVTQLPADAMAQLLTDAVAQLPADAMAQLLTNAVARLPTDAAAQLSTDAVTQPPPAQKVVGKKAGRRARDRKPTPHEADG